MSALIDALTHVHGLSVVDAGSIDAFLTPGDGPEHALLFFAGESQKRPETADVAVILPELAQAFAGRLRCALVAAQAEQELRGRFQVYVFPSLVLARAGEPLGVLPKVWDWSDYVAKIEGWLAPHTPPLPPPGAGPRVEIVHSARS